MGAKHQDRTDLWDFSGAPVSITTELHLLGGPSWALSAPLAGEFHIRTSQPDRMKGGEDQDNGFNCEGDL